MKLRGSSRFLRLGGNLANDQRGTSFIELAIAAPVLLLFLAGITDLGMGFSERYRLQQAVNRTLEIAQSGRDTDFVFLAEEAATAAQVPVSNVRQEQWVECGGSTNRRDWADECPSGETARYVKLTITGSYAPLLGSMGYLTLAENGTVTLTAHATLRVR
jgi:Tfp pilus assembly protein PilW